MVTIKAYMRIVFFIFVCIFLSACSLVSKKEKQIPKIEKQKVVKEIPEIKKQKIVKEVIKPKIIDCKNLNLQSQRIECYTVKASKDDFEAVKKLGLIYHNGIGTPRDYKKSFHYFSKYLEKNSDIIIQREVAYFYKIGALVKQDYKKAYELYSKSAKAGDVFSMSELGYFYTKGYGVEKDYKKAFIWFEKAANLQSSYSKSWLGFFYEKGLGVQKDLQKAKYWYKESNSKYSKKRLKILNAKG